MKLLVDNALSPLVAQKLHDAGYDAIHVRDLGLATAPDEALFDLAFKEERIILTADTDFGTLLALRQVKKPSVVIFRQSDKRPLRVVDLFLANLPAIKGELEKGAVVVFKDKRIRIRLLPLCRGI